MIHCNFRCPALKNKSIKVGQIINLFFYIDFVVKNCKIVYKSKAPAWAKARPSQVQLLTFGPAHNFLKPELPKARPKLGLSGQARASTSLILWLDWHRVHVQQLADAKSRFKVVTNAKSRSYGSKVSGSVHVERWLEVNVEAGINIEDNIEPLRSLLSRTAKYGE